jgi:hypothetical protein
VPVFPLAGPVGTLGVVTFSDIEEKLPVIALFPFMVRATGLEDPVALPLQLVKAYPEFADPDSVTCSPCR